MPRVIQRNHRSLADVHRCTILIVAVCLMAALLVSPPRALAASEAGAVTASHQGISLVVLPAKAGKKYDVSLVDQDQALRAIQGALDLIFAKSPASSEKIDELKNAGHVVIIYDPNFPWKEITTITMAAFMPKMPEFLIQAFPTAFGKFTQQGDARLFITVVGRHGIKHSSAQLAGTIVHELAAHGIQDLQGRIKGRRSLDVECEAFLYQLGAFQDFEMDKFSRYMVVFRKQLRNFNCDDFRRYMQRHKPEYLDLWDQLDVDVPHLLEIFEDYEKFGYE